VIYFNSWLPDLKSEREFLGCANSAVVTSIAGKGERKGRWRRRILRDFRNFAAARRREARVPNGGTEITVHAPPKLGGEYGPVVTSSGTRLCGRDFRLPELSSVPLGFCFLSAPWTFSLPRERKI